MADTSPLVTDIASALPVGRGQSPNGIDEQTATVEIKESLAPPQRLSPKTSPFKSRSVCYITVTDGAERRHVPIPIRSVSQSVERELRAETMGKIPSPPIRQHLNPNTMEYDKVPDESDPAYVAKVAELTNAFIKRFVLAGLDCTIESAQGDIVWEPDGSVQRSDEAIQALEDMGWTSDQITHLREKIAEMSQTDAQIEERERRKKSL